MILLLGCPDIPFLGDSEWFSPHDEPQRPQRPPYRRETSRARYMLGATNFVEHYSEFHATHAQHDLVKSAMYAGSILGMIAARPQKKGAGVVLWFFLCFFTFRLLKGSCLSQGHVCLEKPRVACILCMS